MFSQDLSFVSNKEQALIFQLKICKYKEQSQKN